MKATAVIFRERPIYEYSRRAMDCALALLALIVAAPILLAAAIAIKLDDGGPIFFTQRRVGRFERLFVIYKLRTMSTALCGDALSPSSQGDSRITRVGRILRKTSIDELPQLFNVVRGEMALVGPRPEMPFIVKRYEPWQHLRHLVTPGITGLWQTTCRSTVPLHLPEATEIDLHYIRTASHVTNGAIVARTIQVLVAPRGAF
jgi:lipopolysaccharide/colanic/teichoic acid biosynthesis glycosyltransferase